MSSLRPAVVVALAAILALAAGSLASATTINVPADYTTIQAAIDAAVNGDTVLVAPGTYHERIDFLGKAITVASTSISNPAATVINGDAGGSVVTFKSGETAAAVLGGFTITNGSGTPDHYWLFGGGVYCYYSSPTLINNTISGNSAVKDTFGLGGGVYCSHSSPTLTNNTISGNSANRGGGVSSEDDSSPTPDEQHHQRQLGDRRWRRRGLRSLLADPDQQHHQRELGGLRRGRRVVLYLLLADPDGQHHQRQHGTQRRRYVLL